MKVVFAGEGRGSIRLIEAINLNDATNVMLTTAQKVKLVDHNFSVDCLTTHRRSVP